MTIVVVEGVGNVGVDSTSQRLAHELQAIHLALYEGPWRELTAEGHLMANEIAIQLGLQLNIDLIMERCLPTTWVIGRSAGFDFDQFKLAFLDNILSKNDHLGVLIKPRSYEEWFELCNQPEDLSELCREDYDKFDDLYQKYIKGSQMRWIITDPFPDIERILRHLDY